VSDLLGRKLVKGVEICRGEIVSKHRYIVDVRFVKVFPTPPGIGRTAAI
jgi:hypothetical protein